MCLKLVTGAFRVGVSRLLVTRALANLTGPIPSASPSAWSATPTPRPPAQGYARLIAEQSEAEHLERGGLPYLFLAHPLQAEVGTFADLLGPPADWLEWKWDGIRAAGTPRRPPVDLVARARSWSASASRNCTAWPMRCPKAR